MKTLILAAAVAFASSMSFGCAQGALPHARLMAPDVEEREVPGLMVRLRGTEDDRQLLVSARKLLEREGCIVVSRREVDPRHDLDVAVVTLGTAEVYDAEVGGLRTSLSLSARIGDHTFEPIVLGYTSEDGTPDDASIADALLVFRRRATRFMARWQASHLDDAVAQHASAEGR
jgi:hypothetical protein